MLQNKENQDEYYLAYGTNLNVQNMISHCPDALLLETERLYGYRLVFRGPHNGEAWLSMVKDPGSSVPVALWQISPRDKQILNAYEKCPQEHDELHLILAGRHCFTYIIRPTYPYAQPSEEYYQLVEAGYKEMGFDLLELHQAILNH